MTETLTCPHCLHAFRPDAARPCEHPAPTYTCPRCRRCSCYTGRRLEVRDTETAPDPVVEAFRRREPRIDTGLYETYRDVFDAYAAVPVGIDRAGTLFVYTTGRAADVRTHLHADLIERKLPVRRVITASVERLPAPGGRPLRPPGFPIAVIEGATVFTVDGRAIRSPEAAQHIPGIAVPGSDLVVCIPHVEHDLPDAPPERARVRMLRLPVDLVTIRAWLGDASAVIVSDDTVIRTVAAACGLRPAGHRGEALIAEYTVTPDPAAAAWYITRIRHADVPVRHYRIEAPSAQPCDCGACPGYRVQVRLAEEEDRL